MEPGVSREKNPVVSFCHTAITKSKASEKTACVGTFSVWLKLCNEYVVLW